MVVPMRRNALLLLVLALAGACSPRSSQGPQPLASSRWFATWTASPSDAPARPLRDSIDRTPTLYDQTLRLIVRTSIGGDTVRIRISNEYGDRPLVIGATHIAARTTGSSIDPATDRALTFSGRPSIRLRPGGVAFSDPVAFAAPALRDLAISFHLPDSARLSTRHALAVQTNYVRRGNSAGARDFPADTNIYVWPFLVGVDVTNSAATGVISAIGNSITDGAAATRDANTRWPNILAERLLMSGEPMKAVVNAGISGGRVLTYGSGPSALARFDRDVLMTPGLTHVILLEGINDIGRSAVDGVTADDIIAGYRQLIARAHDRGIVIIGGTLTPASPRTPFTAALEAKRVAVNAFVRNSGEFDGVIDFDRATQDPANPTQFLPAYDSGDHLHPGDAGYRAMGEAIDLALFRRR
ncbi:MAG: lysophospholipase [Gemmatimonadetes bacterium]|nr:lysophospholipase [Gemmatimonadota bacterium]